MTVNERVSRQLGTWTCRLPVLLQVLALGAGSAGCVGGTAQTGAAPVPAVAAVSPQVVVPESYESERLSGDNIDSLAVWGPGGWLLATAKSSDSIIVLDVASGAVVRRLGVAGTGAGEFKRPNGIAVVDDLLVVVERDNRRLQVLALPELRTLGFVGADVLRFPYGVAAFATAAGRYEVYVTDSYQRPDDTVPPEAELGERVRHFRIEREGATLRSTLVRSFGATSGVGALHVVESIAADPSAGRLLIADEADGRHDIKVYSLDGEFAGQVLGHGLFRAEPEGIALIECGEGGFWVTTDQQKERTVFYLLDRRTFAVRASFTGNVVANTDGIVTSAGAVQGLPGRGRLRSPRRRQRRGLRLAGDCREAGLAGAVSGEPLSRPVRLARRRGAAPAPMPRRPRPTVCRTAVAFRSNSKSCSSWPRSRPCRSGRSSTGWRCVGTRCSRSSSPCHSCSRYPCPESRRRSGSRSPCWVP